MKHPVFLLVAVLVFGLWQLHEYRHITATHSLRDSNSHETRSGTSDRSSHKCIGKGDAAGNRLCHFENVCYEKDGTDAKWSYYYKSAKHAPPVLSWPTGDINMYGWMLTHPKDYIDFIDVRANWLDGRPECDFDSCQTFVVLDEEFPQRSTLPLEHSPSGQAHMVVMQPFWPENFGAPCLISPLHLT